MENQLKDKKRKKAPWKKLGERYVFEHPGFLKVRQDSLIREADGVKTKYTVIERRDFVIVIARLDKNSFLFERQWRYPLDQETLELPMGMVDPGENPRTAAARELEEETGFKAGKLKKVGDFFPAPGLIKQKAHIFLAEDLKKGEQELEGMEKGNLKVLILKEKEIEALIQKRKILDILTLGAFWYYKNVG